MNGKNLMLCIFLLQGFACAYQDMEDELFKLLKDRREHKQFDEDKQVVKDHVTVSSKEIAHEPAIQFQQIVYPVQVTEQFKKKLEYKELYDNFEKYEAGNLEEFIVDKDQLLKEADEEIALFDELEEGKFYSVVKYGGAAVCCLVALCVPWVSVKQISEINDMAKVAISTVGGLGLVVFSGLTGLKANEYSQLDVSLKKRHEAIKELLTNVP